MVIWEKQVGFDWRKSGKCLYFIARRRVSKLENGWVGVLWGTDSQIRNFDFKCQKSCHFSQFWFLSTTIVSVCFSLILLPPSIYPSFASVESRFKVGGDSLWIRRCIETYKKKTAFVKGTQSSLTMNLFVPAKLYLEEIAWDMKVAISTQELVGECFFFFLLPLAEVSSFSLV